MIQKTTDQFGQASGNAVAIEESSLIQLSTVQTTLLLNAKFDLCLDFFLLQVWFMVMVMVEVMAIIMSMSSSAKLSTYVKFVSNQGLELEINLRSIWKKCVTQLIRRLAKISFVS